MGTLLQSETSLFPELDAESIESFIEEYLHWFGREPIPNGSLASLPGLHGFVRDDQYHDDAVAALTQLWVGGYRPLGVGTTRVTFATGDGAVAKVPINELGVYSCVREALHSAVHGKMRVSHEVPIADCSLDSYNLILWMEEITPVNEFEIQLPDWAYLVDSSQVGYDQYGTLVAYDL